MSVCRRSGAENFRDVGPRRAGHRICSAHRLTITNRVEDLRQAVARVAREAQPRDVQRLCSEWAQERSCGHRRHVQYRPDFPNDQGRKASFVSRGNRSGAYVAELALWQASGVDIEQSRRSWYKSVGRGEANSLPLPAPSLRARLLGHGGRRGAHALQRCGALARPTSGEPATGSPPIGIQSEVIAYSSHLEVQMDIGR
jgi:hypothetical protein